jgi:Tfp pilus assembly protein PilF
MYRVFLLIMLFALGLAPACTDPSQITARDLNRFAVKAEHAALWKEAEFRLREALKLEPSDARLHNNLAVALEAQAKIDDAHKEYEEAIRLAPDNATYRRNFNEFMAAHRWENRSGGTAEPGAEEDEEP